MIKLCFGVKGCECDEEVECTVLTVRNPYYGHVLQQQIYGHLGAGLDSEKSFIIDPTMRFEAIKEVEKAVQRERERERANEEFKHCFKNLSKHTRSMATPDSRSSVCGWG